ncbi:UNKNOWN [Stylonychia lemnae]|uniref:Uncharacterized protein n=1 Tax=Stylonychia lemnae TaxID=5949 RepID=A0A078A0R6_STYLE|nr:UNKNOWN [Stylonychia lemnae]|eukprot:CDW75730.1 UNKNOWN [Stylonychia lemnae]
MKHRPVIEKSEISETSDPDLEKATFEAKKFARRQTILAQLQQKFDQLKEMGQSPLVSKFRQEQSIKSFTNEDDVKSKLIYETITRTNDTEYFKYMNGINDKMSNVEAILQYSKDPYSYMLHKNRRLLIKLLNLQKNRQDEISQDKKYKLSTISVMNRRPSQPNISTKQPLSSRKKFDAYVKLRRETKLPEHLKAKLTENEQKDLTQGLLFDDGYQRMNEINKVFTDRKLIRPKTNTGLGFSRNRYQNSDAQYSMISAFDAEHRNNGSSSNFIGKDPSNRILLAQTQRDGFNQTNTFSSSTFGNLRPKTTFSQTMGPFNQKTMHLKLQKQLSIRQPFIDTNKDLEIYHDMPKRHLSVKSFDKSNINMSSYRGSPSRSPRKQQDVSSQIMIKRLDMIRKSCADVIQKSKIKLKDLQRQRDAKQILDDRQNKYFELIATTVEEEDPTLIEAYYEFKKREDDFAKIEIKKILQDFKISSLTFQQQLDMAKWDYRYKRKKRNKNTEIVNRMQQELNYKPIQ